jgi:hypothetical protein
VQALVTEVLGDGDGGIDARLARRDRHVRGVRDDDRAFHQCASRARVDELRELLEHASHLVAALATAEVDDDVGAAALGKAFEQDRLAGSESSGDRALATERDREQRIEDALSGHQRLVRREARTHGTRRAHRPEVAQRNLALAVFPASQAQDRRHVGVLAGTGNPVDVPRGVRWNESLLRATMRAADATEDGTRGNVAAAGNDGFEHEARVGGGGQRPQQAVEDVAQQPGADADAEEGARAGDFDAGPQARCVLVYLRDDLVLVEADHLAQQTRRPDADGLAQQERALGARTQHRAADPADACQ